jgi:glycosyltransferase involved in cell wall biosynthesis
MGNSAGASLTSTGSGGSATPTSQAGVRKIKVLHLIVSLEVGGAQHGMLLGLPRFDRDRYEHILCSIMDRMQMASQFREAGIEVRSLGLSRKTDFGVALRLRALLKELRPDILHTYLLHGNVLGRMIGRLAGVPVIIGSERTIGQARRWGRLATRLTNPLTDAVEVNSEIGRDAIEKDLGVPREKIEVVRSGLDLASFESVSQRDKLRADFGVEHDQHLVVYMGRLRPVKGVEYGIRAFAAAREQVTNIRMVLAGEGEQREFLDSLVRELGIADYLSFLGVRHDVPELLGAADSVLMPSLTEGFPRTAIEAMAAGKPVIATGVGGTPEAIVDEATGILVPPQDVDALAAAIVRLAGDTDLQARLGKAGRERAVKNYSIDKYVSRLDRMYRQYSGIEVGALPADQTLDLHN